MEETDHFAKSFDQHRNSYKIDPDNMPTIIRRNQEGLALPKVLRQASKGWTKLMNAFTAAKNEWSYDGECGPHSWDKKFADAHGKYQSPINIDTRTAQYDETLHELVIDDDHHSCAHVKNNGFTFQVDGYKKNLSTVSGGPVRNKYSFLQFHMHWGETQEKGSEHLLDGKSYAAELHFVNWNHDLYKTSKAAASSSKSDGLLVLAVLIQIGKHNDELEKLFELLEEIHLKDHQIPVQNIDMLKLMPANKTDYWTYPGSLTTPPCFECVQWIIFREPVEISGKQLKKCQRLYSVGKEELCNEQTAIRYNNRPVCPIEDRRVRKSFRY